MGLALLRYDLTDGTTVGPGRSRARRRATVVGRPAAGRLTSAAWSVERARSRPQSGQGGPRGGCGGSVQPWCSFLLGFGGEACRVWRSAGRRHYAAGVHTSAAGTATTGAATRAASFRTARMSCPHHETRPPEGPPGPRRWDKEKRRRTNDQGYTRRGRSDHDRDRDRHRV